MAIAYPTINGFRHGWAQVEIEVAGGLNLGVTECNYSPNYNQEKVYAQGPLAVGRTLGKTEYEGDFSMLLEEFNVLTQALGPGFATVPFNINVSYDSPNNVFTVITDNLIGCLISGVETSGLVAGSSDAIVRKCKLSIMSVLYNGLSGAPAQLVG